MTARTKPLPAATRRAIRLIATALVCADLESAVVAGQYEKATGKPYDYRHPDSYFNAWLSGSPECARLWQLLQKDVQRQRQALAEGLRRERDC